MENYSMIAKTFFGFEDILEKELRQLGAMKVEKGIRSVSFSGDKGFMYKAKFLNPFIHFVLETRRNIMKNYIIMLGKNFFLHHILLL